MKTERTRNEKKHLQAEHPTANLKQTWNKQQKWTQGPERPLISLIAPFLRGCAQGQFFPNRQCRTAENNQINQTKWKCCPQGTCSSKLSNKKWRMSDMEEKRIYVVRELAFRPTFHKPIKTKQTQPRNEKPVWKNTEVPTSSVTSAKHDPKWFVCYRKPPITNDCWHSWCCLNPKPWAQGSRKKSKWTHLVDLQVSELFFMF